MKTLIFLILGVVLGVGGSTAVIAPREKARLIEAARVAEEVAAAAADGVSDLASSIPPTETGTVDVAEVDDPRPAAEQTTDAEPPTETAAPQPAQAAEEPQDEPDDDPPALATTTPASALNPSDGAKKLGKVFGAMKPDEAARVMSYLDDDAVVQILMSLRERPAAAILSNLDADRAARLSVIVMKPGT